MDPIKLQQDIRHNQEDAITYMRDLKNWTEQVKKKDEALKASKNSKASLASGDSKYTEKQTSQPTRTLDHVKEEKSAQVSEPSPEVVKLKEAGNEALKNKQYATSIEHYTAAMKLDPSYAILPANRGMAHLKLEQYPEAERDCGLAIQLDPRYIKAYLRRGTARLQMNKLADARVDYLAVLKLEPHNTQARDGLRDIQLRESRPARGGSPETRGKGVSAAKRQQAAAGVKSQTATTASAKPPHLRSKKPLKRVEVVDVRDDEEMDKYLVSGSVNGASFTTNARVSVVSEAPVPTEPSQDNAIAELPPESAKTESSHEATSTPSPAVPPSEAKLIPSRLEPPSKLPPAPESSYEFLRDWKLLRTTPTEHQRAYLRQIAPDSYASVFRQSLEESILVEVLRAVEGLPATEVAAHLRGLSRVPRVHLLVMFLSTEEKALLVRLLEECAVEDVVGMRTRLGV